ncbi:MAG: LPXTG cell wall anchor domain-containing protein [Roseburia sp.]|nr:LPXTG cell wall anchor domain-containing protein [Roseburia sp.]
MKGLGKKFLALTLALVLLLVGNVSVFASNANNTVLIQKQETVEGYTQITTDGNNTKVTATYNLRVKREDDEFNMYKLTNLVWEKTSDGVDYVRISWVPEVQSFINSNEPFNSATFLSADTTIKKIYETPLNLGEAEDTTDTGVYEAGSKVNETYVIELLKAIRKDETTMNALKANYVIGYHGNPYDGNTSVLPSAENSSYEEEGSMPGEIGQAKVTPSMHEQEFLLAYTISDMPIGLCFIDVTSGPRVYQPVLVDLMPVQVGPTGNWYVKNTQEYSLKYEDARIEKKINDADYDIVREGEIVNFNITVDVPLYHKGEDSNYIYTLLNVYDDMAQGYTLIPTSINITYKDADGNDFDATEAFTHTNNKVTATDADTTYTAFMVENAYVYYATTDGKDVFYGIETGTSGELEFWANINGEMVSLGTYRETVSNLYGTLITNYNNKVVNEEDRLGYVNADIAKREHVQSILAVRFDYTKLMDTLTVSDAPFVPDSITISYDAKINDNSFVGNDENTNDAFLYYTGDSAGNRHISQDTVKAWTYALNIVKVNGNDTSEYLAGAKFDLYRLDATYCGGEAATAVPSTGDYMNYSFYRDADGNAYDASRANWEALIGKAVYNYYASDDSVLDLEATVSTKKSAMIDATADYKKLDQFAAKFGALTAENQEIFNEYILTQVNAMKYQYLPVEVNECEVHPGKVHYHVQAYTLFWQDIESVADAEGISVTGLDTNTYILVETVAPEGYHQLDNGLQFVINEYNEDRADAAGGYKGFVDDNDTDIVDGIYQITVENFEGLVLPSTGGTGTLLFTIIGIMLMLSALVVIITKNRKEQSIGLY